MLAISATLNAAQALAKLERLEKLHIPKSKSIAAEAAAKAGANAMAAHGTRVLDEPTRIVFNGGRARNRRGWIYFDWDEKHDIARKRGDVDAFVQIQGRATKASDRTDQREALHRQIYGTTETRGTAPAVPYIIKPTRYLLRKKTIRGVPLKIDKHGNLKNYRSSMNKILNNLDKGKYIHIPLGGGAASGLANNGIRFRPGLYLRFTKARRYKRHAKTGRRGAPYKGEKKRVSIKYRALLLYYRIAKYKSRWDFKKEARPAMLKEFTKTYRKRLLIEVKRELAAGGLVRNVSF